MSRFLVHARVIDTHQIGLFIVRAWYEPGSTSPFRAQVRITSDISRGLERTLSFSDPQSVQKAIAAWLAGITASPTASNDGPANK